MNKDIINSLSYLLITDMNRKGINLPSTVFQCQFRRVIAGVYTMFCIQGIGCDTCKYTKEMYDIKGYE